MEIVRVTNYEEMSEYAAELLFRKVQTQPNVVLGLATGGTPEGTYEAFIEKAKRNDLDLSQITTFNLDEYEGLASDHPNSYHAYMKEHLFHPLDLKSEQTHLPKGNAADLEAEAKSYEQLIEDYGGIDLQLLGIGENGHIGFNEPGTPHHSRTHIVELKESTREANARYFENKSEVPKRAITMGIASIMDSRCILLLASGERKKQAMKNLLEGDINETFPASILRSHPYVTIIADEEALSAVSEREWKKHDSLNVL
ncbi:glucosamine-6-phosphate deaminase [Alteribacillus bidgolensis]|uniref:Glucosamine-6-phosphate deaminase n=1 Tax=Alteribacillus bidgolensis TaxID=930129 RepID=A0A1G8H0Y0_9BACI|nr:glucosamine-6-phosphate deaminase [Alteribacillus bidgolensis]SDI00293.1 glucosamine-6-phosphate deaminase [Alteribacillus bidgolensis]